MPLRALPDALCTVERTASCDRCLFVTLLLSLITQLILTAASDSTALLLYSAVFCKAVLQSCLLAITVVRTLCTTATIATSTEHEY
eukprot:10955-Heterococcus_DN1.PRE.5